MYTDQLIQNLIVCPKTIIEAPKDSGISRCSYKLVFDMSSVDGQYDFKGFISRNTFFHENFSIGLVYVPKEEKGKICLFRCNGLHGETEEYATLEGAIQFYVKHINILAADRRRYFPPPSGQLEFGF